MENNKFGGEAINAKIAEEEKYLKVSVNSTTARGGYKTTYDLSKYRILKADIEIANKGISSNGCDIGINIFEKDANVLNTNAIIGKAIIAFNETSKKREVYFLNIDNLEGTHAIFLKKNATYPSTSAIYNIYNLWLEE